MHRPALSIRSAIELIQGFRQLRYYSASGAAVLGLGALWQIKKISDNELSDILLHLNARSCYIGCHNAM
jgi:hypothetical protein